MRIIIVLLISFFSLQSQSQIVAPKLVCVQKGTNDINIYWLTPNENCGAFLKYYIYYSPSKSVPFKILDSVSAFNTTSYNHLITNSTDNFCYYLTSNFACPGNRLSSDTFCSIETLPTPDLVSISIENGFPVYTWIPVSNYPQIWAYAIFNQNVSIDTFYGYLTNTCIDSTFDVKSGVYTGSVYAMDYCGGVKGRSSFELSHQPCFLTMINNACDDEIELNWTKYQGWDVQNPVKEYEIYAKINSKPTIQIGTNAASVLNFIFNGFVFGDTVCIWVKAIHPTQVGIYSHSNKLCFISTKSQKPDVLQTLSASYIDNYATKVRWFCSPDAIPQSFDLVRRSVLNDQKLNTRLKIPYINEGNGYFSYVEVNGEPNQAVKYQVVYQDMCNNKNNGSPVVTNFIKATQVGLYTNEITWPKKYFHDSVSTTVQKYELFFSPDMINYSKIATINPGQSKYTHNVEDLHLSDGKFCYKLIVYYSIDSIVEIKDSIFTEYSQMACMLMRTVMWMPNAFKINGYTPVFKPKMYFFSEQIFKMRIFNRWGQQIFETNDYNQGWNGIMQNGQVASEDSYIYHVSYRGNDGISVDKHGTFVLLK